MKNPHKTKEKTLLNVKIKTGLVRQLAEGPSFGLTKEIYFS